jgi:hypothetical protein
MDKYVIKRKILDLIANAHPELQPRDTHVFGNWLIQSWLLTHSAFPIVTVRMTGEWRPVYGFHPPTISYGEMYDFIFTCYIFHDSMTKSREVMDAIIDYLETHNTHSDVHILDIREFTSQESILSKGTTFKYWRTVVTFRVIVEESLS